MITALPPPPTIEQPAPYQLSYGVVAGVAASGTRRVIVRAGTRTLANKPLRQRRFQLRVSLPTNETSLQVVTVDRAGRRSKAIVHHVLGATPAAMPQVHAPRSDALLAREVRLLAESFGGTSGIYVENLTTGAGAAWNARATFPAASTLKLAIAVTALARTEGVPGPGSTLDRLLRQMLTYSDNAAANGAERYFGGSTHGGSSLVNSMMHSLGLVDTEMYGGYALDAVGEPPRLPAGRIPLRIDSQPGSGRGKKTSAYDLASLMRAVWLASGGRGPLRATQPGFTAARCPIPPLPPGPCARPRQARSGGGAVARGQGAPQGRLDSDCASRQRHRLLAGRRARRDRDDLPSGRCGNLVRRARR